MLRLMKTALAVCIAISLADSANAATVVFTGTTTAGSLGAFAPGSAMSLVLQYTPVGLGGGLVANVTAATLTIQGVTSWTSLTGVNTISIVPNGGGNDNLSASLNFNPASGLGTTLAALNFTISGGTDLGLNPDATEANVNTIMSGNPVNGSFTFLGGGVPGFGIANFSGTAVPEPGSIALLSCLGLVFGRGAMKRRKLAKELAA